MSAQPVWKRKEEEEGRKEGRIIVFLRIPFMRAGAKFEKDSTFALDREGNATWVAHANYLDQNV